MLEVGRIPVKANTSFHGFDTLLYDITGHARRE